MMFPFDENTAVAVITCAHVLHKDMPILYVSHDAADGMWQFLCGGTHQLEDATVVSLLEIYERDPSIAALAQLPLGCAARRKCVGDSWTAQRG